MKILIISSYLPYPLFSGGHIRLFNIIKELSKKHKITLVCEKRDYQTEEDVREVEKMCDKVISVERKKQWTAKNILSTGFSTYPFLLTGHKNNKMKKEIEQLLENETFDLIHVETFYIMQNLPETKIPIVLAEHNIEYLVYKRFSDKAPFVIKPMLNFDVWKIKMWEERFWKKAKEIVAVSKDEKDLMLRKDVKIIPNGVDLENFKYQISNIKSQMKEKRILFIGDFRWIQNRDSAEWILKEVWPLVKSKVDVKLWIVGRKIPDYIKKIGDESVIFDENAEENTSLIFNKAFLLLSPIRVGGGTSYKILEAMASGVPVITTSLGIQGIEAKDNESVLVAETKEDIAQKLINLMKDEKVFEKVSKNARKVIEEKYDWKKIVKSLEDVYELAIN